MILLFAREWQEGDQLKEHRPGHCRAELLRERYQL